MLILLMKVRMRVIKLKILLIKKIILVQNLQKVNKKTYEFDLFFIDLLIKVQEFITMLLKSLH